MNALRYIWSLDNHTSLGLSLKKRGCVNTLQEENLNDEEQKSDQR